MVGYLHVTTSPETAFRMVQSTCSFDTKHELLFTDKRILTSCYIPPCMHDTTSTYLGNTTSTRHHQHRALTCQESQTLNTDKSLLRLRRNRRRPSVGPNCHRGTLPLYCDLTPSHSSRMTAVRVRGSGKRVSEAFVHTLFVVY